MAFLVTTQWPGRQSLQTKAGVCYLAGSDASLPGAPLRNSDLPGQGIAFTGSELIMSFYELQGLHGTHINVKHACQPCSLGECHTLTKLKAAATLGGSCGLPVRRCGQDPSPTKLLSRSGAPEL